MDHIEKNQLTPIYDNEYDKRLADFHVKAQGLYDEIFMQTVEDIEMHTALPFNPQDKAQADVFEIMLRTAFVEDVRIRQEIAAPRGGEWLGFSGKGLYSMHKDGLPIGEPAILNDKHRVGGKFIGFAVISYVDEAFLDADVPLRASGQTLRVKDYIRPFGIHYAMEEPFIQKIHSSDEPRALPADKVFVPIHSNNLVINRLA